MKPNNHDGRDGAICADPPDAKDDSNGGGEIDLYGELVSFSQLTPTGQLRSIAALENASADARKKSQEALTQSPTLSATPAVVEKQTTSAESTTELPQQSVSIPPTDKTPRSSESSSKLGEPAEIRPAASGPRPSGPLSGLNLPPNIVYTGTIAAGACISCGAETGEDDLFCVACGGFVDDIETIVIVPKCRECKKEISSEEVFCPFCGAATVG